LTDDLIAHGFRRQLSCISARAASGPTDAALDCLQLAFIDETADVLTDTRRPCVSFRSDSYEWLVVAGGVAQYKGQGTINGEGEYEFMLWAADGAPDVLRVEIWQEVDGIELVVYDSAPQPLERGNIIIQKAQ
jgi:hypothetical protein